MTNVIIIGNVLKRLADVGITDVPKKYYDVTDDVGDEYKVGFDSNNGSAAIHIKTSIKDIGDNYRFLQIAAFYPNGGWSAIPMDDKWVAKYVFLLEAAEAMIIKEFKGE